MLICALVVLGVGTLDLYQHYRLSLGASLALSVARALPLVVCLSRPMAGWWLALAASGLTALLAHPVSSSEPWPWPVTSVFALVVVLVLVGLQAPRRVLVELWLLLGLISAAAWLAVPDRRDWLGLSTMVVASAIALLLADAWRGRNETGRRLVEQEQISQAEHSQRVLLEERARIARELHDVVAHHMSVIAVRAETAPFRIPGLPEAAKDDMAETSAIAREALDEMRRLLGVLRGADTGPERAPQPGMERLDALVAGVRGAGLAVDLQVTGGQRPLPAGVELSAYRILQEALSNTLRHAPGAQATVEVHYEADRLRLRIQNDAPPIRSDRPPPALPGQGIIGMRERAAMLAGELTAGPTPEGCYLVEAVLPLLGGPKQVEPS